MPTLRNKKVVGNGYDVDPTPAPQPPPQAAASAPSASKERLDFRIYNTPEIRQKYPDLEDRMFSKKSPYEGNRTFNLIKKAEEAEYIAYKSAASGVPPHPPPPYPHQPAPTHTSHPQQSAPMAPAPTPSVSVPSAPQAPTTQNYKPVLRYEVFGANKAALKQVFLNLSQNFLTVENEDELLSDVFTLEEAIDSGHTTLVVMDVSAFLKETISSGRHKLVISFSDKETELVFKKKLDGNTSCVHIEGYDKKDDLYEAFLFPDTDVWDEYIISTKVSFSKNKEQGLFTKTWNWVTGNDKKQEPAGPTQTTATASPPTLSGGYVPTLSVTGPAPTSGSRIYVDDDDEGFVSRPSSELTVARAYLRNVTIHHNKATNQITSVAISVGDVKKVMSTPHYKNKGLSVFLAVHTTQGLAIYNINCPEDISDVDVNTIEFNVNAPVGAVAFWVFTPAGPFIKKQGSVEFDPVKEDDPFNDYMYDMARDHATFPRIFYGTSSFRTRNKSTRVVGLRMWETMGESVQTAPVAPVAPKTARPSRRALTYGHGYASATPQPQKKPVPVDGGYFTSMFGSGPTPSAPRVVGHARYVQHVRHAQPQSGPTPQNSTGQGIAQMTGKVLGKGVRATANATVGAATGLWNFAKEAWNGGKGEQPVHTTGPEFVPSQPGYGDKPQPAPANTGLPTASPAAQSTAASTGTGQGQPAAGQTGARLWLGAESRHKPAERYVDNILNFFGVAVKQGTNKTNKKKVAEYLRRHYYFEMKTGGTENSQALKSAAEAAGKDSNDANGYLDYDPVIVQKVIAGLMADPDLAQHVA